MVETELAPSSNGARADLPKTVAIETAPTFSANQLRVIRAVSGLPLEQALGDQENVWQALAYLELRRQGYELTWDEAGEVGLELGTEEPDPTSLGNATASPHSADSGE
jgi:hypothetical protein